MIDTVFGIKVRMSGLCINRYQPIIGQLLDADYRPGLSYRCISSNSQDGNSCMYIYIVKRYNFAKYVQIFTKFGEC